MGYFDNPRLKKLNDIMKGPSDPEQPMAESGEEPAPENDNDMSPVDNELLKKLVQHKLDSQKPVGFIPSDNMFQMNAPAEPQDMQNSAKDRDQELLESLLKTYLNKKAQ